MGKSKVRFFNGVHYNGGDRRGFILHSSSFTGPGGMAVRVGVLGKITCDFFRGFPEEMAGKVGEAKRQ